MIDREKAHGPRIAISLDSYHAHFIRNDNEIGWTNPKQIEELALKLKIPFILKLSDNPLDFDAGSIAIFNNGMPRIWPTGVLSKFNYPVKGYESEARKVTIELLRILYPAYKIIIPGD